MNFFKNFSASRAGNPHRLAEHEFANLEDVAAYEELEYVKTIRVELDIHASNWSLHKFILHSDYSNEQPNVINR